METYRHDKTMPHKVIAMKNTKVTPQKVIRGDDDIDLMNYNSNTDEMDS
jgi:hypothetical protein